MTNEIYDNKVLRFDIDGNIYSVDVLFKCFYWYGADFIVTINPSETLYSISISSKDREDFDHIALLDKIKQDLIDYKLRDIVTKETMNIRELIVAKAFAYYGVNSDPITEISDPVGFNPTEF